MKEEFSEEHLINFAATEYVLEHNRNDKYVNEDWEEFVGRKMHEAYVAGYKKGKEKKMTDERLAKAITLKKRIEQLEDQLTKWNQTEKFKEDAIAIWCSSIGRANVDVSFIDFDVMKTLVISKVNKMLEEVKEEYKNL